MSRHARRFDVHLVNLDPTRGGEIQKTRPCLIVSPNEMNRYIRTVIVAPMTSKANCPECRGELERITDELFDVVQQ